MRDIYAYVLYYYVHVICYTEDHVNKINIEKKKKKKNIYLSIYLSVTSQGERMPQSMEIQHSQANKEI